MAQIKRETAMICTVDDLLKGNFVRTEGWNPSYFSTRLGDVSRVNLIGVIVSKENAEGLLLDDGSGRILLRSFGEISFSEVDIGDLILVIGRPRTYNEQNYVLPEIIRKISQKWGAYRQLQLDILRKKIIPEKKETRITIKEEEQPVNHYQKIIAFIRDLDSGSGADTEEVIKRSGVQNGENFIRKLIEEGEIFEFKPGKLKVLE
jgi:RPA family protein